MVGAVRGATARDSHSLTDTLSYTLSHPLHLSQTLSHSLHLSQTLSLSPSLSHTLSLSVEVLAWTGPFEEQLRVVRDRAAASWRDV